MKLDQDAALNHILKQKQIVCPICKSKQFGVLPQLFYFPWHSPEMPGKGTAAFALRCESCKRLEFFDASEAGVVWDE